MFPTVTVVKIMSSNHAAGADFWVITANILTDEIFGVIAVNIYEIKFIWNVSRRRNR